MKSKLNEEERMMVVEEAKHSIEFDDKINEERLVREMLRNKKQQSVDNYIINGVLEEE